MEGSGRSCKDNSQQFKTQNKGKQRAVMPQDTKQSSPKRVPANCCCIQGEAISGDNQSGDFVNHVHFVEGTSFADRDASGSGSTGNNELRPMARTKRVRMHYTPYQLGILENQFKWNQYASYSERGILAKQLQLSEKQVKVWFQNRRSKDRQRKKMEGAAADEQKLLPDGGPGGSPIGESSCTKERAVSSDGGIGEGDAVWFRDTDSPSGSGADHSQDESGQKP